MGTSSRRKPVSAAPVSVVRVALVRFVLLSFVTLVALGAVTVLASRRIAAEEALRHSRVRAEAIAASIAAPLVDSRVRVGEREAMEVLDKAMRDRIRYGSVSHIVLWDVEGRILWAEDGSAVGDVYPLSPRQRAITRDGGTVIQDEESDDREPHPGRDAGEDHLHEIYVGAVDADGVPFLFEAYLPQERLDEDYRAIIAHLMPISLGMLLLLQLANLPLALSLARRIDRSNAHRRAILQRSLSSWHEERRGLAQSLHDGVIQDLSAMSYALPAVVDQLPEGDQTKEARAVGERMSDILVRSLAALRATTLDLAPAQLDGSGIVTALESLRDQSVGRGLGVTLDVAPDLDLGETSSGLVYRVVREGLRNVEKHARARSAIVSVRRRDDQVEVVLSDDGQGLPAEPTDEGHLGLRLHAQLVRDVGGTLTVSTNAQGGVTLRAVVPARLPDLDDGF